MNESLIEPSRLDTGETDTMEPLDFEELATVEIGDVLVLKTAGMLSDPMAVMRPPETTRTPDNRRQIRVVTEGPDGLVELTRSKTAHTYRGTLYRHPQSK